MRKLGIILALAVIGGSSNGRTAGFELANEGSNPSPPAKTPVDQAQYDALALYWHAGEYARALLGCPVTQAVILMPANCRTGQGTVNAEELRELRRIAKRLLQLKD